jgi:hypothetical protein
VALRQLGSRSSYGSAGPVRSARKVAKTFRLAAASLQGGGACKRVVDSGPLIALFDGTTRTTSGYAELAAGVPLTWPVRSRPSAASGTATDFPEYVVAAEASRRAGDLAAIRDES